MANENPFFNFLNVRFWMKIQNSAWFQHNNFICCNFSFPKIFYIHAWRTCFAILKQNMFVQITRAYIFVVMKMNERKVHIFVTIHFCIIKNHLGIHYNNLTHITTFSNLIFLSEKSHILENASYLACVLIGSLSVNTTAIYMEKYFVRSIVPLITLLMNLYDYL